MRTGDKNEEMLVERSDWRMEADKLHALDRIAASMEALIDLVKVVSDEVIDRHFPEWLKNPKRGDVVQTDDGVLWTWTDSRIGEQSCWTNADLTMMLSTWLLLKKGPIHRLQRVEKSSEL